MLGSAQAIVLLWPVLSGVLFPGFRPVGTAHGVTVYRRPEAAFLELLAEGRIAAPPAVVQRLLVDYPNHPRFMRNVAESRVLAQKPTELLAYQRLRLPVVDDRDYLARVSWGRAADHHWIRVRAEDSTALGRRGVVRVRVMSASWRLEPAEEGRATRAVYHLRIDLGGVIPRWLVAPNAARELPALFQAIRWEVSGPSGPLPPHQDRAAWSNTPGLL